MRDMVIHHTADRSFAPQYKKVWAYHDSGAGGKWPAGHGIQYTVFIERDGQTFESYDLDKVTWHSGSPEWNKRAFGVCIAGDFTYQIPTEEQLEALFRFWKSAHFPAVYYHGEVRPEPTSCPGYFDFKGDMTKRWRDDLELQLSQKESALKRFLNTPRGAQLERIINRIRAYLSL